MPTLPAPYPFLPSGGDLPISSTDDVLAAFPARIRDAEEAPVRDAVVESLAAMLLAYQERADYAAAQSDPSRATGASLRGLAADRGIYAQDGEGNESIRTRIYSVPDVVTPGAILAAVNSILAQYTTKEAKIFESVTDRLFLSDGTATWHSFLTDGDSDIDPQYQDRRYDERDNAGPGGAWLFSEHVGRYFILRVPDLAGINDGDGFMFDGTQGVLADVGLWIDDGSDADGSSAGFIYQGFSDALSVYQAIVNTVERIRGHGVRWMLRVDPKL